MFTLAITNLTQHLPIRLPVYSEVSPYVIVHQYSGLHHINQRQLARNALAHEIASRCDYLSQDDIVDDTLSLGLSGVASGTVILDNLIGQKRDFCLARFRDYEILGIEISRISETGVLEIRESRYLVFHME